MSNKTKEVISEIANQYGLPSEFVEQASGILISEAVDASSMTAHQIAKLFTCTPQEFAAMQDLPDPRIKEVIDNALQQEDAIRRHQAVGKDGERVHGPT